MTNRVAATDSPNATTVVRRLGFWSAVLTAVFAAAFFAVRHRDPGAIYPLSLCSLIHSQRLSLDVSGISA
ncbi:MAG: hypothetical protein WCB79_04400, partial [Halobacteriota archaeon]